jgi:hypothetical protein
LPGGRGPEEDKRGAGDLRFSLREALPWILE